MSTITFSDVSVRYGKKRVALSGFSDSVDAGEWVGLIGPNGAGKSSLLRAIVGLVDSSGSIEIDGTPLDELSDRDRAKHVAYVAQDPLIPDDMTAYEYVLLGRTPYISYFGSPSRTDRIVASDVIDRLRLGEFANRLLGELSGGERQRVVLARALAQQAPVLLLDEPTSALDIGHQQQALELVTELRRSEQLTIISALHDLTLAGTYTDRLVMLHHGDVVVAGDAADVLTADRLGEIYNVCVTVDVDIDELGNRQVVVVPRRGFPAP
ncbi:MAG: iron complex transport system ATP-binding protein [Candidatus Azotimanducaceae bacterium]|jgi:iron complex transport system ATP-binding protein|tara:strand:- start:463 stop:1263 length:801 start_codon:yes stop_codon:yes gene_type:complete